MSTKYNIVAMSIVNDSMDIQTMLGGVSNFSKSIWHIPLKGVTASIESGDLIMEIIGDIDIGHKVINRKGKGGFGDFGMNKGFNETVVTFDVKMSRDMRIRLYTNTPV